MECETLYQNWLSVRQCFIALYTRLEIVPPSEDSSALYGIVSQLIDCMWTYAKLKVGNYFFYYTKYFL